MLSDILSRMTYSKDGCFEILNSDSKTYISQIDTDASVLSIDEDALHFTSIDDSNLDELENYYRELHRNSHFSVKKAQLVLQAAKIRVVPHLLQKVWRECESCDVRRRLAPATKLRPRNAVLYPLDLIHIDFVSKDRAHLRGYDGHCGIFTIVDEASRFFYAFPVDRLTIRPILVFLGSIMSITGHSVKAISADNAFDCVAMNEFCSENDIEIQFRPSNSSRSVLVETYHKFMHNKIAAFTNGNPRNFAKVIHRVVTSLNAQVSDTTHFSPYYLFYGRQPESINQVPYSTDCFDKYHLENLRLAKYFTDRAKSHNTANYKFRVLEPGTIVEIRYSNSKNHESLTGTVLHDSGGSTAKIQLEKRFKPIIVHKRHIYLSKKSPSYDKLFAKHNSDACLEFGEESSDHPLKDAGLNSGDSPDHRRVDGDVVGEQLERVRRCSSSETPETFKIPEKEGPRYNLRSRNKSN